MGFLNLVRLDVVVQWEQQMLMCHKTSFSLAACVITSAHLSPGSLSDCNADKNH